MLKQSIDCSAAKSSRLSKTSLSLATDDIINRWPAEALLQNNLAALRSREPILAERIAQVILPLENSDTNSTSALQVRMVVARDGSVTFRLHDANGKWNWLGFSSTPRLSGRANVKRIKVEQGNLAMNGIGHGMEAKGVLDIFGGHQALFVTEKNPLLLNLVLRLHDFSTALAGGRLVFIAEENMIEGLVHYFETHPGYNLITQCVAWPWLTDAENHAYHQLINQAVDASALRLQNAVNQLHSQLQEYDQQRSWSEVESALRPTNNTADGLQVINISRINSIEQYCRSRDALAGLAQLGAQCHWQMSDRPEIMSPWAQTERLLRQKPHLIILIDTLRGHIKGAMPEKVIAATLATGRTWQDGMADATLMGPKDAVFTTTKQQHDELIAAGFAHHQVFHLPLATDTQRYHPLETDEKFHSEYAFDVALICDRLCTKPESYQINLPTHQALWRQLVSDLRNQPERYSPQEADKLIRRAQRCGVELRQDDLQRFFRDMLNHVLAEAVLPEAYGMALVREGINLGVWYNTPLRKSGAGTRLHYWDESPLANRLIGPIDHGEERNRLFNTARMILYFNPSGRVERLLLDAAAAGAMVLVRGSRDDRRTDGLGAYFTPGEDIITFDTPADLVRKVRFYLTHEPQRKALVQKTCQTVITRHSYQIRMREMLERLTTL